MIDVFYRRSWQSDVRRPGRVTTNSETKCTVTLDLPEMPQTRKGGVDHSVPFVRDLRESRGDIFGVPQRSLFS